MRRLLWAAVCLVVLLSLAAYSGTPATRVRRTHDAPDLQQITARSGQIFLGRVESIEWKFGPGGGPADRVRITLRVLDGIRGARTGESVTIEEWSGLWSPGNERYQPGQTVMLFLYPQSKLGLTSPVGGEAGRLEITPTRRVVLSPDQPDTLLPRSLRLQKGQAALEAARAERTPYYDQFAQIVRELAAVQAP